MATLHIIRSEPDETVEAFVEAFSENEKITVKPLYAGKIDWSRLVDDIFDHDRVVCWW